MECNAKKECILKIAIVENDDQRTSSIFEQGFIAIYEKNGEKWRILNRFENEVSNAKDIATVRRTVLDTIKQLGDVKILIASEIPGIAPGIFETAGFEIVLVENSTLNILDSFTEKILKVLKKRQEEALKFDIMQFLEPGINEGYFYLNMEEILVKNPQLTSKIILTQFLEKGGFNRLEVTCSHVPKWFDRDFVALGFEYQTLNSLPNKKTVRIIPVQTP
jgi:Fe-only nitrogenase accessory protein AnfO